MTREIIKKDKMQKKWEQIRLSLVPKDSTSLKFMPIKKKRVEGIIKDNLKNIVSASLEKIKIVFNEDYILFKEDSFGLLRNEQRLIPLHKGTENIINLYVRRTSEHEISYTNELIIKIPSNIVAQYKEQSIKYETEKSVLPISIDTIIDFYTKYNQTVPTQNMNLRGLDFLNYSVTPSGNNWASFTCYRGSEGDYYKICPYYSEGIHSKTGFAFVISKHIQMKEPIRVLAYALENFKAPKHPLLNEFDYKVYNFLKVIYNKQRNIENKALADDLYIDRIVAEIDKHPPSFEEIKTSFNDEFLNEVYSSFVDDLCSCDTKRSNIQEYEADMICDINKGHWDIFEAFQKPMEEDDILIPILSDSILVARDPLRDVNYKASCAIDFGTKSTVVVYHDRKSVLLRIGAHDLWSKPRLEDYENPTVINLIDYKRFMKDYRSKDGRPLTRWEDITVSHQAANAIFSRNVDKDIYYSIFSDLKQWANSSTRRQLLRDRKGQQVELKPYTTLRKNDFDPIEIYAYYLGLNINNMHNGICAKYFLSFPVNYSLEVRNQILESFKRGIKKSLPERVLNDIDFMKRFKVKAGASEPAAYALSALKEYGVEPTDYESNIVNTYAVFDFGGGTTDFDFGIEYIPEDKSFDYEVKQFGNGGDPLLGGENILNILAYELYKNNIEEMRKNKVTIVRPNEKCSRFAGSEMLVKESDEGDQASYLNLKLLASVLRPLWEETKGGVESFADGKISVDLYSVDEERKSLSLKIDVKGLQEVIKQHVDDGVDNFIQSFRRTYKNNSNEWTWPLHILLAGNSCKSRILQNQLITKLLDFVQSLGTSEVLSSERDVTDIIRLYPPLGSTFDLSRLNIDIKDNTERKAILVKMLYGYEESTKEKKELSENLISTINTISDRKKNKTLWNQFGSGGEL